MLTQVQVKNFKSIGRAVVSLEPFTAFVGQNGAGKSNFVDVLRFIAESLTNSVGYAIQNRGGIEAVRRRSRGHPVNFGFRLLMDLEVGPVEYSFEITAEKQGRFSVKRERCRCGLNQFEVNDGELRASPVGITRRVERDRLALTLLSGIEEFRPAYDAIAGFRVYALSPDRIRDLQDPDPGEVLKSDGSNAAAVLREIKNRNPENHRRLSEYLAEVVPGIHSVDYKMAGPKEMLEFRQDVGDKKPWAFDSMSMSDGTLRVLGVLLAVYQVTKASVTVIEEPEATIHPAALEVLLDILMETSSSTQMILTTHSPDLLDHERIQDRNLRVVQAQDGETRIGPVDSGSRRLIANHLFTTGALLRQGELDIDAETTKENSRQLSLFGAGKP